MAFKRQKWLELESLCAAEGMSHSQSVGLGRGGKDRDGGAGCRDGRTGLQ